MTSPGSSTIRAARQRIRWAARRDIRPADILMMDRKGVPRRGAPVLTSSKQLQAHIRIVNWRTEDRYDDD